MTKQLQATLAAILVISSISVPAQTTTATPTAASSKSKKKHVAAKAPRETATERQIRELREQMQNQQAEIDNLKSQSVAKDAALAAAQQSAANAQTVAAAATSQAQTVNATVQANIAKAGDLKPSASLTADGGKIVPASCGTTLDNSIETDSKGFGVGSSGIAAELNYSKGIIAVFSATHGSLASGLANTLTTSLQQLFSACSTMQVIDGTATVGMTMTKVADHTDAAQTWALAEGVDVSGTKSTTTVIEALDGNIFITDTAIGGTNADAVAAVNAIVAAAKG